MKRPVALITGASSGIGRELAVVFAEQGYDLVIAARREQQLRGLASEIEAHNGANCEVHVVAVDLAKAKGPGKLQAAIRDLGVDIEVLVNNAGVAESGPFHEQKTANTLTMVNLNVRALTELTLTFARQMTKRGSGRILNVASIVAFQPVPSMAVYSASKAYVLSLTESVSEELKGTGVTISALCPGLTRTEMVADVAVADNMPQLLMSDPREVAEQGFRACMRGEVIEIPGILNQAFVGWTQTQPRWAYRMLSGLAARTSFNWGDRS
ncbi:MAG: SDR family NAD(P)-dependent oxidoreductase [Pseudomonadales bacterium]